MSDFQCNKKGENWDSPKKASKWLGDQSWDIISWDKKGSDEIT